MVPVVVIREKAAMESSCGCPKKNMKKDLDYYKKRGLSIGENVECYSIDGIDSLFPWLITIGNNVTISTNVRKRQTMRQSLKSTPPIIGDVASCIRPEDYLTMA